MRGLFFIAAIVGFIFFIGGLVNTSEDAYNPELIAPSQMAVENVHTDPAAVATAIDQLQAELFKIRTADNAPSEHVIENRFVHRDFIRIEQAVDNVESHIQLAAQTAGGVASLAGNQQFEDMVFQMREEVRDRTTGHGGGAAAAIFFGFFAMLICGLIALVD